MMGVFRKTANELREGIYHLLGYKVDITDPIAHIFKLSSIYAESPDDFLYFEVCTLL